MKKAIIALSVAGTLISGYVFAADFSGKEGCSSERSFKGKQKKPHNMSFMRFIKELDLTDAQKESIYEIVSDFRDEMEKKRMFGDKRDSLLKSAITESGFDKSKFITEANESHEERLNNRADMIDKVFKVLTDAQKTKLYNKINS